MKKRVAVMQPYFLPYLGYWQLIAAVDCFVLLDDVQYINRGWISRNRILKPTAGWQYIHVPVAKHRRVTAIRDVEIASSPGWKTRIINQFSHYKTKAPHFSETLALMQHLLYDGQEKTIAAFNHRIIRQICDVLSIQSEIVVSSERSRESSADVIRGDRLPMMAASLGATELINPEDGISLLNLGRLERGGITLSALLSPNISYLQGHNLFEPRLSIIDTLAFNGIDGTKEFMSQATIKLISQKTVCQAPGDS